MLNKLTHLVRLLRFSRTAECKTERYCLTFTLQGVCFGVDIGNIKEIVRLGIFAVPRDLPRCLRALYRHKRSMIPVLDIAARYGQSSLRQGGRSCLVVVGMGRGAHRQDIGLMVDEVLGMARFSAASVRPLPDDMRELMRTHFIIEGMVAEGDGQLILLRSDKLLQAHELREISSYVRHGFHVTNF